LASATSTPVQIGAVKVKTIPFGPPTAPPETTARITSWLKDAEFGRTNDRVSPGLALAYAATASAPKADWPAKTIAPLTPEPDMVEVLINGKLKLLPRQGLQEAIQRERERFGLPAPQSPLSSIFGVQR
jgi:hypothetical protein